ncbi:VQ domain-containing protein [Psidium guajava]|nr:VQ domain-containing protein [Psidium guajava]
MSPQTGRVMDNKPPSLQGPRPEAMAVNRSSAEMIREQDLVPAATTSRRRKRVTRIVYLRSPKVIHVEPGEFMAVVQQLTGNQPSSLSATSWDGDAVEINTM